MDDDMSSMRGYTDDGRRETTRHLDASRESLAGTEIISKPLSMAALRELVEGAR